MNFTLVSKPKSLALIGLGCFLAAAACSSSDNNTSGTSHAGSGSQSGGASGQAQAGAPTAGQSNSSGGAGSTAGGATSSGGTQSGAGAPGAAGTTQGQAGASGGAAAGGSSAGASAGGAAGGSSAGGAAGAGGSNGVLKIMAIGDSITRATCWRARLWQLLNGAHAGKFDLVGTLQSDNGCSPAGYDQDNQGYSSSLVTEIVNGVTTARTCDPFCPTLSDFTTAFNAKHPDVILMHFGTNDVWNAISVTNILNAYSMVVDTARAVNPNVKFFVAQIIPMDVSSTTCSGCTCPGCTTEVPALNSMIPTWATGKATSASPITVVDQYTGFDATPTTGDTRDGVHPNDSGSQKMANNWYAALTSLF